MSSRAVSHVDAHTWVLFHFCQSADYVADALLHLRVGALHRVKFYGIGVLACFNRRNRAAAHADAVVVAAHDHDFLARFRSAFYGILHSSEPYSAQQAL